MSQPHGAATFSQRRIWIWKDWLNLHLQLDQCHQTPGRLSSNRGLSFIAYGKRAISDAALPSVPIHTVRSCPMLSTARCACADV
jgi:hypothetical protein